MSRDSRTTLARPDLADMRLEGVVRAGRFEATDPKRCAAATAAILAAPEDGSEQQDELLFGEGFDVLEVRAGWAWGQARRDGYVGFVRAEALGAAAQAPTHRVRALRTPVFSRANLKSKIVGLLSFNSLVCAGEADNGYAEVAGLGWIFAGHLIPIGVFETDAANLAERFLGAPYVWGGRSSLGLDCSGLIQQALQGAGHACPRDTDQQLAAFSKPAEPGQLRRGDLVFWEGHVGMMLDGERLIHANAHHMATAIEPLAEAVARIREKIGSGPVGYKRP